MTGKRKTQPRVYVLFCTVRGCSADGISALLQNTNVLSVEKAEGPADVIAMLEAPSQPKLAVAVMDALSEVDDMVGEADILPA